MIPANDNRKVSSDAEARCAGRWFFFAFGWLNVAVGMVGVVVPGLPTTVFLIIALWAFPRAPSGSGGGCGTIAASARRYAPGTSTG